MKVHENYAGRKVVAVSDADILDTVLEDTDKGLELKISREFYGENEFELKDILQFIVHADNVNVIGNKIVDALISEKMVDSKNVISIRGVKHAQIYNIAY
ncbi:MAG: DUF424 family protein [Candidatus Parvarchaeota archaeon]|nr:DUF424 family protein [Candidatus Parvarchaeota archaeon]MCL5101595.1 DUF424 family protein [Candidatus Parvarchaeota archaeon]